ncbi:hypothetical protein ACWDA9_40775, partial [Streptomyces sp. NPDC001193]
TWNSGAAGCSVGSALLERSQGEREGLRAEFEPLLRRDTGSHGGGAEALDGVVGVEVDQRAGMRSLRCRAASSCWSAQRRATK